MLAVSGTNQILGAVVFFGDMKYYGSGGTASQEPQAAGFRLLAVGDDARGQGIGKMLTLECITRARLKNRKTMVIHTMQAMMLAWRIYERMGFLRAPDLDFIQGNFPVFGFRYYLTDTVL
jgi:ribosomal protein S18 acetylase RimI-like enzyme